jgi:hypothetical protein
LSERSNGGFGMRTVVVGGGIAGLAAALALHRRGDQVQVWERAAEFAEVGAVGSLPGGGRIVACGLGHRHPPRRLAGTVAGVDVRVRLGAVVPPSVAIEAVKALPLLGAGLIEIGPVSLVDVPREGPGWFARVIGAASPIGGRRSRSWRWGLLLGLGMIVAGLAAIAITLGPLLLWYDRSYLGVATVGHHLAHFLQHDRISLAGTMIAIGVLYAGLSLGGLRRGWPWAREALLASGWIGFPTLFYFVGTGFVDVLHLTATLALFPLFLLGTRRRGGNRRPLLPDGPERQRRHALIGQLLLVITGLGIAVGGAVVSIVGLTTVFVPSDLAYLHTTAAALNAANPRLLPYIARTTGPASAAR